MKVSRLDSQWVSSRLFSFAKRGRLFIEYLNLIAKGGGRMESFLVRKIKGSAFLGRFEARRVSLLEIIDGESGEFFKFVLHLKVVPSSAAAGVGTSRIILLDESEAGQAIERYFSVKTGVGRNFPGIRDDQWHISPPWFDQIAENCLQGHILTKVNRPFPT